MNPIKIGFLTPYSGIYPNMSNHVVYGLLMPFLKYSSQGKQLFAIEPEYIKQGGTQAVKDAVQKLIFFNQVDIISGFASYRSIPDIMPTIEQHGKLAFFFDSGEYIPHVPQISPNIFYNSLQLWQSEYALGQWAQQEYGGKGGIVMGLYDSGYHMHSAFQQGVKIAGATEMDLTVLGKPEDQQAVFAHHVDNYLTTVAKNPPDYIHALFCGQEAIQFMAKYYESPLRNKVPLVISNHMASSEILEPLIHLDWDVYSASIWSQKDSSKPNQTFVKGYQQGMGQSPNMFNLLGYEAGLMLREMTSDLEKRDWKNVQNTLQKKSIRGPRGNVNFYPKSGFDLPSISIEKLRIKNNKITRMIVAKGQGLKYDHDVFNEIHQGNVSGWQNPYFCV